MNKTKKIIGVTVVLIQAFSLLILPISGEIASDPKTFDGQFPKQASELYSFFTSGYGGLKKERTSTIIDSSSNALYSMILFDEFEKGLTKSLYNKASFIKVILKV